MNSSTSLTTGGITVSAATLEPAVSWALTAMFHAPVPESVSVLVTGLLGAAVHAAINYLNARSAKAGARSMIRLALCLLLGGCAAHVEVLPTFDQKTYAVGCCVVMAQIPPSTDLSVAVQKTESLQVKLGAKWRF